MVAETYNFTPYIVGRADVHHPQLADDPVDRRPSTAADEQARAGRRSRMSVPRDRGPGGVRKALRRSWTCWRGIGPRRRHPTRWVVLIGASGSGKVHAAQDDEPHRETSTTGRSSCPAKTSPTRGWDADAVRRPGSGSCSSISTCFPHLTVLDNVHARGGGRVHGMSKTEASRQGPAAFARDASGSAPRPTSTPTGSPAVSKQRGWRSCGRCSPQPEVLLLDEITRRASTRSWSARCSTSCAS